MAGMAPASFGSSFIHSFVERAYFDYVYPQPQSWALVMPG